MMRRAVLTIGAAAGLAFGDDPLALLGAGEGLLPPPELAMAEMTMMRTTTPISPSRTLRTQCFFLRGGPGGGG